MLIYKKAQDFFQWLYPHLEKLPRTEKYSRGSLSIYLFKKNLSVFVEKDFLKTGIDYFIIYFLTPG